MSALSLSELAPAKKTTGRRPGRPPKNPNKKNEPKEGIQRMPLVEDALYELVYDNPYIFKKCLDFILSGADKPLLCKFMPNSISLLNSDRFKKNQIQIKIDCTKLNRYYCEQTHEFAVGAEYLQTLIKKIDKSSYNMFRWYSDDIQNTCIDLNINNYKSTDHATISCSLRREKVEDEAKFDDDDYPIKFKLDGKFFKKKISDVKGFSDVLTIKQNGSAAPLIFEYSNDNRKLRSEDIFGDHGTGIELESKIGESEIFNIEVNTKYLYQVANTSVFESKVHLWVSRDKPMMATIFLDNDTIRLKVLTELKDQALGDTV